MLPSLVKVILVAITVALVVVAVYPWNDQRGDQIGDQAVLIRKSDSSTEGLRSKAASTTHIQEGQGIQRLEERTKVGSSNDPTAPVHSNGLCLSSDNMEVTPGDAWTLAGTTMAIDSEGEKVTNEIVKTFVVDRIDDAQWTVDGRLVLVRGSNAVIRSLSWGMSEEEPVDSFPNVEELVSVTIKVTDLSPVLTLDWECHKQAWMDGRAGVEEGGDGVYEPSFEETVLDSGLRVVIFSVTQASDQSGGSTTKTLERRWGYDKRTGRLALYHHSETFTDGRTVSDEYVMSPDSPRAVMTSRAPIERVSIDEYWSDALGGWSLSIVSGLPDSCWSLVDNLEAISSDTIQIEIKNVLNTYPEMGCDQAYRKVTTNIPITGIEACKIYTANVNDVAYAVQATDTNVGCEATTPQLGQEYALAFGGTVRFESEGLRVGFMDLQEDSRCPSDVTCTQAGRVKILMDTAHDASRLLGGFTLTLGIDLEAASEEFQGYTVTLVDLNPYPISTQETRLQDYIATVVVTKQ